MVNRLMNIIAPCFKEIKEHFKTNINKNHLDFDEDIFVQTIESCNKSIPNEMHTDEAIHYLWKAFKNNTLREKTYARNKYKTKNIPPNIIDTSIEFNEDDYNNIKQLIIDKFGDELFQLFLAHANGKTYTELEKLTTIPNLQYKFRCIRNYVRKHYKLNY